MTFIYWLVKRYKQRRSRLAATSQQVELKALAATSEFHAALQRAVEQLPTRTHAAIAEEDVSTVPSTDVECVVCMEPYEEGELLSPAGRMLSLMLLLLSATWPSAPARAAWCAPRAAAP